MIAMKQHFLFRVQKGSTVDEAFGELCSFLTDIYEMEDPETGNVQIGGYSDDLSLPTAFKHVVLETSSNAQEIDWNTQWAAFAPHFHEGLAHIDLGGPILLLKPGAGFGDLSHPTTRLAMALMSSFVQDKLVFDIGCGSGILSIAAALLGAKHVYGIDIEDKAILHSQENAALNHIESKATFTKILDPSSIPKEPFIILMNMIESEQITAWHSLKSLHRKEAIVITSGLLSSQAEDYFKRAKSWGWNLVEEREEEGWLGCVFSQTLSQQP